MDKNKIIEHLMEENKFLRYRLEKAENQNDILKDIITEVSPLSRSKSVKKQALKRDNYKCVKCGRKDNLHVHHKKQLSKGGEDSLDNVETLCIDCHIAVHENDSSITLLRGQKRQLDQ